ncbi:transcription termination factor 3, mitochondrial [Pseudomyrmex gracilis]|uniref:transcription termination factor 3, mitochondrial n=1 Tax=Pseudomyrmex gracilis TaxID=219809 RepID=UPI0009952BCC|nr:transcription termination factor 3, mitochondrial [Pseudomyrmex gracilis]
MSFQRCCKFVVAAARPATVRLIITRFVSTNNNALGQCLPNKIDRNQVDISETNIISKYAADNKNDVEDSWRNSKTTTNSISLQRGIVPNLPAEESLDDSDITLPKPLDTCAEDLSDIGPYLTPTCTFAKYANKSRTIRELVKLGVHLYKLESDVNMVQFILGLDFDRDVKPYIRFLYECGVPADSLGEFFTKNPNILKEDMDDLHTRIRYLRAHDFTVEMIQKIVCGNPKWLSFSTQFIDGRLGYFQSNFGLNGSEVRHLAVISPKVVTYYMLHIMSNTFSIREEMGFDKYQVKLLLLKKPRLWVKNRKNLMRVFDYAHDEMQLSRDIIVQMPQILLCRFSRLQQRHMFLVELKRAQYDPTKPMYVSPRALVSGTDLEFCSDIAKTSIDIYNTFLKTF